MSTNIFVIIVTYNGMKWLSNSLVASNSRSNGRFAYWHELLRSRDIQFAVESYEEAAKRNPRPEVYAFLSQYYSDNGNANKAQFYRQKYTEATQGR